MSDSTPALRKRKRAERSLKSRAERQQELLRCIAHEGSISRGAVAAGVARRTLYDWRQESVEFEHAIQALKADLARHTASIQLSRHAEYVEARRKQRYLPPQLRQEVMERDAYRCRYCGGYRGGLVIDHVVPFSSGGPSTPRNLVTACHSCNSRKADRTPEEAGMPLLPVPA